MAQQTIEHSFSKEEAIAFVKKAILSIPMAIMSDKGDHLKVGAPMMTTDVVITDHQVIVSSNLAGKLTHSTVCNQLSLFFEEHSKQPVPNNKNESIIVSNESSSETVGVSNNLSNDQTPMPETKIPEAKCPQCGGNCLGRKFDGNYFCRECGFTIQTCKICGSFNIAKGYDGVMFCRNCGASGDDLEKGQKHDPPIQEKRKTIPGVVPVSNVSISDEKKEIDHNGTVQIIEQETSKEKQLKENEKNNDHCGSIQSIDKDIFELEQHKENDDYVMIVSDKEIHESDEEKEKDQEKIVSAIEVNESNDRTDDEGEDKDQLIVASAIEANDADNKIDEATIDYDETSFIKKNEIAEENHFEEDRDHLKIESDKEVETTDDKSNDEEKDDGKKNHKKRKLKPVLTIILVALGIVAMSIILVCVITMVIVPTIRNNKAEKENNDKYNKAIDLINEGEYIQAYELLTNLNGFKDSLAKADEIRPIYLKEKIKRKNVGDYIVLGSYEQDNDFTNGKEDIEWLILEKQDNRILVISRYVIDCRPYNEQTGSSGTWASCTLRTWLNSDFANGAFDADEKNMIHLSLSTEETTDRLFIFSVDEAGSCFDSAEIRKCSPTAYAISQGATLSSRNDTLEKKPTCVWWLRTTGINENYGAYVNLTGYIIKSGQPVTTSSGIRPAMWIKLD